MTFTITYTEEEIQDMAKLAAEIEPSSMTQVYDMFKHEYFVDMGSIRASTQGGNTVTVSMSPELIRYLMNNMMDSVSILKMLGRVIVRMFESDFDKFISADIKITKDGKLIDGNGDPVIPSNICKQELYNV